MPYLIRPISLIALSFAAQAVLIAQTPPNMSGTWLIQPDRSDFGSIPAPTIRADVIDHKEPNLTIRRTVIGPGGETTATLVYAVDGKAYKNRVGPNELTSMLKWEGDVLVVRSTVMTAQGEVTVTDRVSLSPDGKTMTLTRLFTLAGQDAFQTMVFAKQE